jgi:hypothetical protein
MLWEKTVVVLEVGAMEEPAPKNNIFLRRKPGKAIVKQVITGTGVSPGDDVFIVGATEDVVRVGERYLAVLEEKVFTLGTFPADMYSWELNLSGQWPLEGNSQEILRWIEKAALTPKGDAAAFFREAVTKAPFSVCIWALYRARDVNSIELLRAVDELARESLEPAVALRALVVEDVARTALLDKQWTRSLDRGKLLEKICSHRLQNDTEAHLLTAWLTPSDYVSFSLGEHFRVMADAASANPTWHNEWSDKRVNRQLDLSSWFLVRNASVEEADATRAVEWLLKRWEEPRARDRESWMVQHWGNQLGQTLPLSDSQIAQLHEGLRKRLVRLPAE